MHDQQLPGLATTPRKEVSTPSDRPGPRARTTASSERMVITGYRAPPIPAAPARRFLRFRAGTRAGPQCADLITRGPGATCTGAPRPSGGDMARESEAVTQRLDDEHYPAYSM